MDELDAEVVSLPGSNEAKALPILFWNFTHPGAVFKGVDSRGILFGHMIVLRSGRGVFWSRSLQVGEILSTDGVRSMMDLVEPLKRYYHVSLSGYNEGNALIFFKYLSFRFDLDFSIFISRWKSR